ncbi:hypothetical protein ISF_08757 [Cordyceps fumosorosea ARSEF 2679]|uniref:Uncharacterized protein n=1 Tax=Cordyceps fumosorosea (strain ARSEF 2679) TaxID=1081104 RepID=A0A167LRA8_CORFA|nr:hypothetical protein ISF_08757 [Cordyceps fumosorosea ARSEF 2679]OAA53404.1 hypothetical protein ISF_08757 [Cordyceps fumosorosea ARSEF 2679]
MPLDTGRISQPDSSSSRRVPSEPSFTVHSQTRTFRDSPVPSDFRPTLPAGSSAGSRVGSHDDFIFPSPVSPFSLQEQSLYGFPSVALPPASASTIYQPDNRDDDDDDYDDDTQAQPDDDWQPPDDEAPDAELSMPPYACGHAGCHKSFRRPHPAPGAVADRER